MRTVTLSEATDSLASLADEVVRTHETVRITRGAGCAAVLMSEDDLESLHETLFWLSERQVSQDRVDAEFASECGRTVGETEIRAGFGLPARRRG